MKVVVAIDSFKGSLSSPDVGNAAKRGILRAMPEAQVQVYPLADGGEGTVHALIDGMGGQLCTAEVTGPLGDPVESTYGILKDNTTAVMEMASAAGITLVPPAQRNPMDTTTFGVGEMIRDAIARGCRKFIVGIGGSATNDGGAGMLMALGYELLDAAGRPIPRGARGLKALAQIKKEHVLPELSECEFLIACDVANPLCGSQGCSAVYGPQKGADEDTAAWMDQALAHYAQVAMQYFPGADPDHPGAGAAGGLGFAFLTFTNAALKPGIEIVIQETGLETAIRQADIVLTGEGRLDGQTAMGKAPVGVAALAEKYQKPVLAVAGSITREASICHRAGIHAYFPIVRGVTTLEEAMAPENASENMADAVEEIFRLVEFCRRY